MIWIPAYVALLFALGLPICLLLPPLAVDRLSPAPVFGLAIVGIASTISYFLGVPTVWILPGLVGLAIVSLITCRIALSNLQNVLFLLLIGCAVTAICMAPIHFGGDQFGIFQANPSDQSNYIIVAQAVAKHSYHFLNTSTEVAQSAHLLAAQALLNARPTVSIVLGAIAPWFDIPLVQLAPLFQAGLQGISVFGFIYLFRTMFGASLLPAAITAAAFAVGMHAQYISDINAWSSLSALAFAPVIASFVAQSVTAPNIRLIIPIALIATGILYYYPEAAVVYSFSCFAIVAIWLPRMPLRDVISTTICGFSAIALAVLICIPAWRATLNFLVGQIGFAPTAPRAWFLAYDAFYFGHDQLSKAGWSFYDFFVTASDISMGMLGLYFLAPPIFPEPSLDPLWIVLKIAFAISLIFAGYFNLKGGIKRTLLAASAFALVPALIMTLQQNYWSAGKAVSIASPFIFIAVTATLFGHRRWLAIPAMLFVALQLGSGVQRIMASERGTGIRAETPYPNFNTVKRLFNFDAAYWTKELADCHNVASMLRDPTLRTFVHLTARDLLLEIQDVEIGQGWPGIGDRSDCTITDQATGPAVGKLIYLATGRSQLADYYRGIIDSVELIGEQATGVWNPDPYQGDILRWTDGSAEWQIPLNSQSRFLIIRLWPLGTIVGSIGITVNGTKIYDDLPWADTATFALGEVKGPITIKITSSAFKPLGDSRMLGLALRSVVLKR